MDLLGDVAAELGVTSMPTFLFFKDVSAALINLMCLISFMKSMNPDWQGVTSMPTFLFFQRRGRRRPTPP